MTFDTVFISDVHLGTPRCNTEKFFKFLKEPLIRAYGEGFFNELLIVDEEIKKQK